MLFTRIGQKKMVIFIVDTFIIMCETMPVLLLLLGFNFSVSTSFIGCGSESLSSVLLLQRIIVKIRDGLLITPSPKHHEKIDFMERKEKSPHICKISVPRQLQNALEYSIQQLTSALHQFEANEQNN